MTRFNPSILLDRVDAIRRSPVLNDKSKRSPFVQALRDKLIRMLDAMHADLEDEIRFAAKHANNPALTDIETSAYELYAMNTSFEERWIDDGPHSVLDKIHVLAAGNGEVCPVTLDYTVVQAEELEGLDQVFEKILRETGVTIIAARLG